jgi:predicted tellurium resistance membrane protein TerC
VMERFPVIITAGAALLGFLAGEMLLTDPALVQRIGELPHWQVNVGGAVGAALVVAIGMLMRRRHKARRDSK